jgi:hypothetical protein
MVGNLITRLRECSRLKILQHNQQKASRLAQNKSLKNAWSSWGGKEGGGAVLAASGPKRWPQDGPI